MTTAPKNPSVLVIDDDPEFLEMVSDYLRWSGYTVYSTRSADEAWSILKDVSKRVDALVCDIQMPNQSGTSFLNRVRADGITVPTILVTGHFDLDHAAAKSMGAEGALVKPFDLRFLAGVIQSHLGLSEAPISKGA